MPQEHINKISNLNEENKKISRNYWRLKFLLWLDSHLTTWNSPEMESSGELLLPPINCSAAASGVLAVAAAADRRRWRKWQVEGGDRTTGVDDGDAQWREEKRRKWKKKIEERTGKKGAGRRRKNKGGKLPFNP